MLAIIIPYYKLAFFEETLQSLAAQTDIRFKVYIGDDASPEDCTLLLEKFQGQFNFEYHRFEMNVGGISLTKQWLRCIALSENEEWLMILGDDDVLKDNVVEEFYEKYNVFKDKYNLVRFSTQLIDSKSQKLHDVFKNPELESGIDFLYRKISGQTRSSLSEYIFRRKVFDKHVFKNYPLAWHSDDKAWVDFAEGKSIYSINNSLVNIRYCTRSISGSQDNLDLKHKASIQFYKDVIKEYFYQFNKTQKLYVLRKYEGLLKDKRILKQTDFFFIMLKYIQIKDGKMLFDFMKRFVKYKIGSK